MMAAKEQIGESKNVLQRSKKCIFCRAELSRSAGSLPGSLNKNNSNVKCEKCNQNEEKYGKPKICVFCQLPAAFVGGKCVHCSFGEKKHGEPKSCDHCKLKAAFPTNDPDLKKKKPLCRLCRMSYKRTLEKACGTRLENIKESRKRPASGSSSNGTQNGNANEEKSLRTSSYVDSVNDGLGEQILAVTQLKDEVSALRRQLQQKDQQIFERDKKMAALNAKIMHLEKEHRTKITQVNKQNQEAQGALQAKIQTLSRQIATLSKSRKPVGDRSASNSPHVL